MSLKNYLLNSWKVRTLYGALARGRSFQAKRSAVKAKAYLYDAVTLEQLLRKAGFEDVRRESFMQGRDATLLIDQADRAVESLYMEACA